MAVQTLFKKERKEEEEEESATHSPSLNDGDDVIDLDVQLVSLVKVLQSAHVCGHRLGVAEIHRVFFLNGVK